MEAKHVLSPIELKRDVKITYLSRQMSDYS